MKTVLLLIISTAFFLGCNQSPQNQQTATDPDSVKTDTALNDNVAYRNILFGISKEEYAKQEQILLAGNKYEMIGEYSFLLEPKFTNQNHLYTLTLELEDKEELPHLQFKDKMPDGNSKDSLNRYRSAMMKFKNYESSCEAYLQKLLLKQYNKYQTEKYSHNLYQIGKKKIELHLDNPPYDKPFEPIEVYLRYTNLNLVDENNRYNDSIYKIKYQVWKHLQAKQTEIDSIEAQKL